MLLIVGCDPDGISPPEVAEPVLEAGSPEALTLRGEGVIRHTTLPEIGRVLVQGHRDPNGRCQYTREVKLGPQNPGPMFESRVEYDPATCRYIFAQHDPDLAPDFAKEVPQRSDALPDVVNGPAMSTGGYASQTTEQEEEYEGGGSGGGTLVSGQQECTETFGAMGAAVQRMWTQDPVNIRVTESEHFVEYSYHPGLCVNWMRSTLTSEWFSTSGWFLNPWDHIHLGPGWMSGYQAMAAEGQQKMRNDAFCPGENNQTVSYYVNHVRAWEDGWPTFFGGTSNTGGCSSLLIDFRYTSRVW